MAATKFQTPYAKATKENGQPLDASDWNALSQAAHDAQVKINDVIDDIANLPAGGGGSSSGGSSEPSTPSNVVSVSSKGNTTISATKHINIEPAYVPGGGSGTYGDVQIKPGDDITLESHHRALDKQDEITVKTSDGKDGSKAPVRLQVIASDVTLSTKGKVVPQGSNDDPEVMNVRVSTGNGKGYLKVRARAIDLRCEEHGGIALQPKGRDGENHMNKIKFEHGGGDGLEFGTFNAEKTSIHTDEYRFKKSGVWKMATRVTEPTPENKIDPDDDTTDERYVKPTDENIEDISEELQATFEEPDDFYDLIDVTDPQCTTEDIIKTAHALNGAHGVHVQITDKGNVEIETNEKYISAPNATAEVTIGPFELTSPTSIPQITDVTRISALFASAEQADVVSALASVKGNQIVAIQYEVNSVAEPYTGTFKFLKVARDINIESCAGIKIKGELDFGSTFGFGETDKGIEVQHKLTKGNKLKRCYSLKVVAVNNHASNNITIDQSLLTYTDPTDPESACTLDDSSATIAPGESAVVAEASIYDIIKLTNWMKANHGGPWQSSQQSSGNELTDNPNIANPIVDNGGELVENP